MSSAPLAGDYRFPPVRSSAHPEIASQWRRTAPYPSRAQLVHRALYVKPPVFPSSRDTGRETSGWRGTESPSSPTRFSFASRPPLSASPHMRMHCLDYTPIQYVQPAPYIPRSEATFSLPSRSFSCSCPAGQSHHQTQSLPFGKDAAGSESKQDHPINGYVQQESVGRDLGVQKNSRQQSKLRPTHSIQVPSVLLPKQSEFRIVLSLH